MLLDPHFFVHKSMVSLLFMKALGKKTVVVFLRENAPNSSAALLDSHGYTPKPFTAVQFSCLTE